MKRFKTAAILLVGILAAYFLNAQSPGWDWAQVANCSAGDYPRAIATDGNGYTFMTGGFEGSITFGATMLTAVGAYDIYVVKTDASGNTVWAKNIGGMNNETGLRVALDPSGNIVLAGVFNSPEMIVGTDTLYSNSWTHDAVFIIKLDASGNPIWASSSTGPGTQGDGAYGLDISAGGNIYLSGVFLSSTISFGAITLSNEGGRDIWMLALDNGGNVLWAKSEGGSGDEYAYRLGLDNIGMLYVGGWFGSDTLMLDSTMLINGGNSDTYLAKYSPTGQLVWASQSSGTENEAILELDIDLKQSRIYVVGRFEGNAIWGTHSVTSAGDYDLFLHAYDSSGALLWYEERGGPAKEMARSVSVNASGEIFVAGTFESDTLRIGTKYATNKGNADFFLTKYASTGGLEYLKGFGGTGNEQDCYVAADSLDNVYVFGSFSGGPILFDSISLNNPGGTSTFLAKTTSIFVRRSEKFESGRILVYPNPSISGLFTIDLKRSGERLILFRVFDFKGSQIFYSDNLGLRHQQIQFQIHQKGMFILEMESESGRKYFSRILH